MKKKDALDIAMAFGKRDSDDGGKFVGIKMRCTFEGTDEDFLISYCLPLDLFVDKTLSNYDDDLFMKDITDFKRFLKDYSEAVSSNEVLKNSLEKVQIIEISQEVNEKHRLF